MVICDICHDIPGVPYPLGTARELEETARLVRQAGQRALALPCDVRQESEVVRVIQAGLDNFGKIDILVNNAAIGGPIGTTWELSEAVWHEMLDINLTGVWRGCKAIAPHFIERHQGRIINISSGAGLKGIGMMSHYAAAKHGVIGLTRSLAIEMAPHGVTVNAICPGSVDTPLLRAEGELYGMDWETARRTFESYHLLPTLLEARDISEACLWLASDAARYVTGLALPVDAGFLQK
jgi:NAD(P)-dependent dehydrogenase (short-subunit alcohol dehydrogenase family)